MYHIISIQIDLSQYVIINLGLSKKICFILLSAEKEKMTLYCGETLRHLLVKIILLILFKSSVFVCLLIN